jgi:RNA polymerase sigma factor (sigma-70 family)
VTREGALGVSIRGTAADDAAEFVRLLEPALAGGYRLAGYLLGNAIEAEDASQEALEKAWRAWRNLRDRDRAEAWFDRIVANVCKDRLRARRGVQLMDLEGDPPAREGSRDPFRDALARDEVGRLVGALTADQQIVVALRFWRDLTLEEIAERLDVPLGTVKSRLHYAMRSLRGELDRQGKVSR